MGSGIEAAGSDSGEFLNSREEYGTSGLHALEVERNEVPRRTMPRLPFF
jgi:hypothetical protein